MRSLGFAAIVVFGIWLASCGSTLDNAGQTGATGSGGTGHAGAAGTGGVGTGGDIAVGGRGGFNTGTGGGIAGTGGSSAGGTGQAGGVGTGGVGTGGVGTGGNCVWANGGGDPQPGPLACNGHSIYAYTGLTATSDGDEIKLVFSGCDVCAGQWSCIDHGDLTALNVEVAGSWATVVGQGFAPNCPVFTVHLRPASSTSEGQFHVTGSFSGADGCHQPVSCPIDEQLALIRGTSGAIRIETADHIPSKCSFNDIWGGSCQDKSFSCNWSFAEFCRDNFRLGECAPTWSAALADTESCAAFNEPRILSCGGYNVHVQGSNTYSTATYYDASSGVAVALLGSSEFGTTCVAGPTQFTPPSCPSATPQQSCPTDAGASD
jgi:hypothetical protein